MSCTGCKVRGGGKPYPLAKNKWTAGWGSPTSGLRPPPDVPPHSSNWKELGLVTQGQWFLERVGMKKGYKGERLHSSSG